MDDASSIEYAYSKKVPPRAFFNIGCIYREGYMARKSKKMKAIIDSQKLTPRELAYLEARSKGLNKCESIATISDAKPCSRSKMAQEIERRIDSKCPEWRDALREQYHPSKYFERLDQLSKMPDDVGRKAALNMLSYAGYTEIAGSINTDPLALRGRHTTVINNILNMQLPEAQNAHVIGQSDACNGDVIDVNPTKE